jgi:hypothetical protein
MKLKFLTEVIQNLSLVDYSYSLSFALNLLSDSANLTHFCMALFKI